MRSTTDSWSCQISIQTDFNEEGRRMTPFGNRIYDKSSVELWIRRAQAAVLSPYHSPTYFFTKTASELKNEDDPLRMQFSTKSVYVEIRDPDSPNLDFVDLPGEFYNYDGNQRLILWHRHSSYRRNLRT